ncbi:Intramembrane metalloprotease (sterol-regulatory element-binding protein (SREBP) protease) [Handroanthus impetiginosus]|uniref:Endopeptidase S2P n=1 Tax=Handroanthus impetiginosus TaxID=429701 RepID=A0A2G9GE70_9LAMI|nr:Intramembrane metalloprotease (sterol-regulatory element-binding protein (SREBP) protease) [Handroanthus impetiginosus]
MDSRQGRRRWSDQTLLPLRPTRQLSSTVSCWYCDFKLLVLNGPLFRFGRRHSRYLRIWFSMGIGFSLAALLGVTMMILCELSGNSLSGLSSLIAGLNISLPSMGYLCISSVIGVIVHELGHALAAAGEGVQMEYVAIFLAGLFPGALVAFNHASLQALPGVASLRIYCAGIWHNAAFCAVCTLALFLLPFILSPFYIHGESPMVLDVPSTSPLSGYLSPHDVIFSLDDYHVHTAKEWEQMTTLLAEQTHSLSLGQSSGAANVEKGYCIPQALIEGNTPVQWKGNRTYCPNELVAFASVTCLDESNYNDGGNKNNDQKMREHIHCLDAKDIIKFRKCAYSDEQAPRNRTTCLCSEVESCLMPVQLPGLGWVEITYSSLECHNHGRSLSSGDKHYSSGKRSCHQTFVFVGDLISMARSIHLTSYQPRWPIYSTVYLPNILEKLFTCAFHVSMVLALLNSLPVFFLDGESILEVALQYFSSLSSRMKQSVLRCCLLVGTAITTYFIFQTIFISIS